MVNGCLGAVLIIAAALVCGMAAILLWPERESNEKRWERMCAGPERYDAMREAEEKGKPNPC